VPERRRRPSLSITPSIAANSHLLIEILLQTRLGARHTDRVLDSDESLHAPQLLDVEALQTIRRLTLARQISAARAEIALTALLDLPLHRHDHLPLLGRVWELRTSMTACDAAYVALAEGLPACCSPRMAGSPERTAIARMSSC
jgi:predicted nucleic acid-binding protein